MFGGESAPPPALPPAPANAPTFASSTMNKSSRNPTATPTGGLGSTILNGGQGVLTPSATAKKSLLGQ